MLHQLTVVGAGLIGGSICLAARQARWAERIVCVDRSPPPPALDQFAAEWIHDPAPWPQDPPARIREALASSSLIVLATPVRTVEQLLSRVLASSSCPVTDCGSTKLALNELARRTAGGARFVPGHPMAGSPQGGIRHARADLFEGHRWILCPEGTDEAAQTTVRDFARALGAEVLDMPAALHDRSVAITSHLPQVVASALAVLAHEMKADAAAGPGFASATRVAGGAEPMWRDIFETNAEPIAGALQALGQRLQELGSALERSEVDQLLETLAEARRLRRD